MKTIPARIKIWCGVMLIAILYVSQIFMIRFEGVEVALRKVLLVFVFWVCFLGLLAYFIFFLLLRVHLLCRFYIIDYGFSLQAFRPLPRNCSLPVTDITTE